MVSLLEQINIALPTWYVTIDLVNTFFYLSIMKEDQKQIVLIREGQQYTFKILLQGSINSTICHNLVHRDLNYMEILQKTIVPLY